ncbi:MAG: hypothetical protein WCP14_02205 [bacterium]
MSYCKDKNCSEPSFKPLSGLHNYLCSKSELYHKWHHHPHHKKVHIAILSVVSIFMVGVMVLMVLMPLYYSFMIN